MAKSFAENVINTNELYYVAQKPLDLAEFNNNVIEEGDYGYGIYLYPNEEEAIKAARFLTLELRRQGNNNPINLYKYSFNSENIDYNKLTKSSWMLKWWCWNGYPITRTYGKIEWNNYVFFWRQYIREHKNDNPKVYVYDCSLVCGPIVDENLITSLWGGDFPEEAYYHNNVEDIESDKPIEFCFKSIYSLRKLESEIQVDSYKDWIALNNKIATLI